MKTTSFLYGVLISIILLSFQISCKKERIISVPILKALVVTDITLNSAKSGGEITSDGGSPVIERGVCWSTSQNPTVLNSKTSDGSGIGSFISKLSGLKPNTTYYLRPFATNIPGTAYGNEITFKSLETGIGTVTDVDGNIYNTITIGSQVWMVENLKTTKYNDGTAIPNNSDWQMLETPAYCWYNDDIANKIAYGALYNWYVVNTGKLCPEGWHVPSDAEWTILSHFLGKEDIAGGKLKEAGNTHWLSPNIGANDEIGFNAVGGGYRDSNGKFVNFLSKCHFWSNTKTSVSGNTIWDRNLTYNSTYINAGSMPVKYGCSVRCIMD